jgi:hypothetical protein
VIRFATPTLPQDIAREETSSFRPFDRTQYGLFGPASGLTYSRSSVVETIFKSSVAKPADANSDKAS